MKTFSINEALSAGWEAFKGRVGFFIGLLLLLWAFSAISQWVIFNTENQWFALFEAFAFQLFQTFLLAGLLRITLTIIDGGEGDFGELFSGGPVFIPLLLAELLYGLIVAGGMILLVVPGLIWMVKFQYYGFFVVDKGMRPLEALKASAAITDGAKWKLFGFLWVLLLINMAGALLLVIGLFVTIPVSMLAMAFVYRKLLAQTP